MQLADLVPADRQTRVRSELAAARARALTILPLPVLTTYGAKGRVYRRSAIPRHCPGCQAHHDDETPGCRNCAARHWMRRRKVAAAGGTLT